jgi:hypothetical protein
MVLHVGKYIHFLEQMTAIIGVDISAGNTIYLTEGYTVDTPGFCFLFTLYSSLYFCVPLCVIFIDDLND